MASQQPDRQFLFTISTYKVWDETNGTGSGWEDHTERIWTLEIPSGADDFEDTGTELRIFRLFRIRYRLDFLVARYQQKKIRQMTLTDAEGLVWHIRNSVAVNEEAEGRSARMIELSGFRDF